MGLPSQVEFYPAEQRLGTPRSHSAKSLWRSSLRQRACSKNKRYSTLASHSGSSTDVPATRLEKQMEAAQSIRTRNHVAHSRVNHHQLLLGTELQVGPGFSGRVRVGAGFGLKVDKNFGLNLGLRHPFCLRGTKI